MYSKLKISTNSIIGRRNLPLLCNLRNARGTRLNLLHGKSFSPSNVSLLQTKNLKDNSLMNTNITRTLITQCITIRTQLTIVSVPLPHHSLRTIGIITIMQ